MTPSNLPKNFRNFLPGPNGATLDYVLTESCERNLKERLVRASTASEQPSDRNTIFTSVRQRGIKSHVVHSAQRAELT